jgi:hypothetical protein
VDEVATTFNAAVAPPDATTSNTAVAPPDATTTNAAAAPPVATTSNAAAAPTVATTTNAAAAPTVATTSNVAAAPTVATTTNAAAAPTVATTTNAAAAPTVATTSNAAAAPPVATTSNAAAAPPVATTSNAAAAPTVVDAGAVATTSNVAVAPPVVDAGAAAVQHSAVVDLTGEDRGGFVPSVNSPSARQSISRLPFVVGTNRDLDEFLMRREVRDNQRFLLSSRDMHPSTGGRIRVQNANIVQVTGGPPANAASGVPPLGPPANAASGVPPLGPPANAASGVNTTSAMSPPGLTDNGALADGWREVRSSQGLTFYYNDQENLSVWVRPEKRFADQMNGNPSSVVVGSIQKRPRRVVKKEK